MISRQPPRVDPDCPVHPRRRSRALRSPLAALLAFALAGMPFGCAQQDPPRREQPAPQGAPAPAVQTEQAGSVEQRTARTPDVHFVPTPMRVVDQMLSVARVGRNDVLYDLGSGDGRIVITAAKRHGARAIGIDIDPRRISESRHNADTAGVTGRVEFREADLFETDLRDATVVTLYLLRQLNVRLRPKLLEELRPGTRVVSHAFDMGDWKADSLMNVEGNNVYYWVVPADVRGAWSMTATLGGVERRYDLLLEQQYQRATGTATAAGRAVAIEEVLLDGERVSFSLPESPGAARQLRFEGRVAGDTMRGSVARDTGRRAGSWRATRNAR